MTFQEFQEAYQKLRFTVPRPPNHSIKCENSDWGDNLYYVTNGTFCYEDAHCNNITYTFDSFKADNCCDGDYIAESDLCYECVDVLNVNNSTYLNYCSRMYESHFCYDCSDSNNLFGCVNLRHKAYCIFNQQYTPEQYHEKVSELKKRSPHENLSDLRKLMMNFPVTQSKVEHSENCEYGNQVFHSKNLYLCFDSAHSEDGGYLYDSHWNKHCYDMTQSHHCGFCYECNDSTDCNNCHHLIYCDHTTDSAFSENCSYGDHLFGCVGLKQKKYCILNKQYSEEEYAKEVSGIMASYTKV